MATILIVYYSKTGHTAQMAGAIEEGVRAEGVAAVCRKVEDARVEELLDADGIVLGSPTYYGTMAAEVKGFIDESVKYHGKLTGKVGGAFTSSGGIGGGNETTIMDMLKALLIHGMIVQGTTSGGHYGPVAIGAPDERAMKECKALGARVAQLVKQLAE